MQFKNPLFIATIFTIGSLVTLSNATAETTTGEFKVGLTIQAACNLTAGSSSNIDLGIVSDGSIKKGTNNIFVACSTGIPYKIGLLARNDGGAGGVGVLKGAKNGGAISIIYKLTQDLNGDTPWGNTAGTNTVDGTGTGSLPSISYPVYATTVGSTNVVADTYSDTIDVTVTY
ncbi:spore coat protein U domain-containing protein [Psychrobacter sp. TAE2020]|uniref:Csu type fimbrial protein n=1 Tax=Psychrobacter sp. TAE2020 TaxID=2846762 RepID=UPI001C1257C4|nr:spore coat U domain-containing protein [Psychrobacter sp. TAE2020]MBU5616204.1 spore coat protein U domain-containing protein [Psychrobacter sp. TAE2020]